MPTVTMDPKTVNPFDELKRINLRFMETFYLVKPHQRLDWIRSYDVKSPYEEQLVQMIIDTLEPIKILGSAEVKVREEMAQEEARGIQINDPAQERLWEAKLAEARQIDKERADAEKARRQKAFESRGIKMEDSMQIHGDDSQAKKPVSSEGLHGISGLGEKSIVKLEEANIKTAEEFHALSYEQKKLILGPVVAQRFR